MNLEPAGENKDNFEKHQSGSQPLTVSRWEVRLCVAQHKIALRERVEAFQQAEEALAMANRLFSPSDPRLGQSHLVMAEALLLDRKPALAVEHLKKASCFRPVSSDTAAGGIEELWLMAGSLSVEEADLESAAEAFGSYIAAMQEIPGCDPLLLSVGGFQLSVALIKLGRKVEAGQALVEAYANLEDIPQTRWHEASKILRGAASSHIDAGAYADGVLLAREALTLLRNCTVKSTGTEQRSCLFHIASGLSRQGDYSQGIKYFDEAYASLGTITQKNSREALNLKQHTAAAASSGGDLIRFERCARELCALSEKFTAENSGDRLMANLMAGQATYVNGKYSEAEAFCKKAAEIAEKVPKGEQEDIDISCAVLLNLQSELKLQKGKVLSAGKLAQEALAYLQNSTNDAAPVLASKIYVKMAVICARDPQVGDAQEWLRRARRSISLMEPEEREASLNSCTFVEANLKEQAGDTEAAAQLAEELLQRLGDGSEIDAKQLRAALKRMVAHRHMVLDQKDEAAACLREADSLLENDSSASELHEMVLREWADLIMPMDSAEAQKILDKASAIRFEMEMLSGEEPSEEKD